MKKLLILTTALFSIHSVIASNLSFLHDSALTYFRGNDKNLMLHTLTDALNHYPDGKKAVWKNAKTGAWGFVMPVNTAKQGNLLCRTVKIYNQAHNVPGEATYRMCKMNNAWKFV